MAARSVRLAQALLSAATTYEQTKGDSESDLAPHVQILAPLQAEGKYEVSNR
jgi:hypothetical protein